MRLRVIVFFLVASIVYSCATPGSPQGGAKDEIKPKPIAFSPANQSLNFSGKEISIAFDENVNITNPQIEVIISPPVEPFPAIIAKRDEVIIKFKEDLRPNTTYQIAFGNSIKDVNEANPADNVQLVFSTGPTLDSMSIEGKLVSAYGEKLSENTFVQIYTQYTDSTIVNSKPLYIYKAGSSGTFKFNYLPRDTFKIMALSDMNSNYLFDLPTESIGEFSQLVVLDSNVKDLSISVFSPEESAFKFKDFATQLDNGIFKFKLNKTLFPYKDSVNVTVVQPNAKALIKQQNFSSEEQTVFIASDSFPVNCVVSVNGSLLDTVRLRASKKAPFTGQFLTTYSSILNGKSIIQHPQFPLQLSFNLPLNAIDSQKITLTDTLLQPIDFQLSYNKNNWSLSLESKWISNQPYILTFLDGAFSYANETLSKADTFNLSVQDIKKYGALMLSATLPNTSSYIVALRTKDGKYITESIVNADAWFYNSGLLAPGTYIVEVIDDANADGRWNSGNYWLKQNPERVFRSQDIVVKENWDQKIDVNVVFKENLRPLPFFENKEDSKENKPKSNNVVPR